MPYHPDDGPPLFYQARMTLQQAHFAIGVEDPDRIMSHYDRVNNLLQTFLRLSNTYDQIGIMSWIETIRETLRRIVQYFEALHEFAYDSIDEDAAILHPVIPTFDSVPTGGRPQVSLPWDTITAYRKANHSWTEIASLLNIHYRTLLRYRARYNYQDPKPYSEITDDELDRIVSQTLSQTASVVGSKLMCSVLFDQGHKVQRHRVRESMSRLDAFGNLTRWANFIPRLVYSVRGPNALWHMDGNLKLVNYGFVLHAAIDGYSRRIIYLEPNTNNRGSTVLAAFINGINSVNTIPQRVRADKGGENRQVAEWMLQTNGVGRGSFITGRSVHNQRIERLWRDVNRWLTCFHLIFDHLRSTGFYDSDEGIDRFSLIFVYLPLLRRSLSQFTRVWNHHKLRTEQHYSPIQLYAQDNPESLNLDLNEAELGQYGIDWNGPIPHDDDDETVIVEPPVRPLTDGDWGILVNRYQDLLYPQVETLDNNLMSPAANYGVNIYCEIRQWIITRAITYGNLNET